MMENIGLHRRAQALALRLAADLNDSASELAAFAEGNTTAIDIIDALSNVLDGLRTCDTAEYVSETNRLYQEYNQCA